ncbi:DUF547 domain-containing protein [Hymenobacter sp. APR13]|uniref:DUF547 domain-containing protein n=1 Tax=Hymenobacter sp. APR13 TaxID=1356852 RepID=UPI0004E05FBB|nr:DUF547 domain-containing protein [Hymenobacter sp. APR13]AII50995.1 hypothetical protein N008_03230 [Hymenobacter sp. APR13]
MTRTLASRVIVLLLILAGAFPQVGASQTVSSARLHAPWDELLHQFVTPEGLVDYQGLLEQEDKLLDYLLAQRKVSPEAAGWSAAEQEAYWINIYNAATVYMVLQYYPLSNVNDIRLKGKVHSLWEAPSVQVGGQEYSLNQIEREKLTARFQDPRLHFALVQGAMSGPQLLPEAYEGAQLAQQLERQTRRFLNDPARNVLAGAQPQLSSLFNFYAAEFGSRTQLLEFVNRYAPMPVAATAPIEFLPFSWALNDRQPLSATQALHK